MAGDVTVAPDVPPCTKLKPESGLEGRGTVPAPTLAYSAGGPAPKISTYEDPAGRRWSDTGIKLLSGLGDPASFPEIRLLDQDSAPCLRARLTSHSSACRLTAPPPGLELHPDPSSNSQPGDRLPAWGSGSIYFAPVTAIIPKPREIVLLLKAVSTKPEPSSPTPPDTGHILPER